MMRWERHVARMGEIRNEKETFWFEFLEGRDHSENSAVDGV